jgi:ferric-dicitrate binding protein FerR (iron transport regulator)
MGMTTSSTPPFDRREPIDPQLLERYWLGQATPEEVAALDAWFTQYPGRRVWYERLREGISADGWHRFTPRELSARIAAIEHAIDLPATRMTPTTPWARDTPRRRGVSVGTWAGPSSRHRRAWFGAVAGVVIAVMALVMGRWAQSGFLTNPTSVATTIYTTRPGQRANITLPDGSTVVLNVASRLEVPTNFVSTHRTVRLTGEALFTVTRHRGAPFTVVVGQTTTRVLGTTFVVRRYSTDTATTVAVHDGKVSVQSAVVTAQQEARVNPHGPIQLQPASPAEFTFARGVLTFDGVPLQDAIAELDRWYDADIRIADPALGTHRLRGTCTTGSLTDLTSILELALNVRVVRDGSTLTLFPK